MRSMTSVLTFAVLAAFAADVFAEHAPELEAEMRRAGFRDSQVARVEAGGLVTRLLPEQDDNAAFVVGVGRIAGSAGAFVEAIRSIGRPGSQPPAGRTLQVGRFGMPPTIDDLEPLCLGPRDLHALARCRVGDCDIQVSRRTMEVARGIGWRAAGADVQAAQLLKTALLERVRAYLREGSPSMPAYDDSYEPERVATGLAHILEISPEVLERNRPFYQYLLGFPSSARPPHQEDFLYWSKERLLNSVVSIVHVFIQREEGADEPRYYVALKHIYDSHYFLAYAEFLTLLPEPGSAKGFYLVRSVRALINPPRGWLRGLLLGRIKHAMRDQLAEDMAREKRLAESTGPRSLEP
jgi:hypothetical protein